MTVGKGHREPHCYSLGSRLLFLSLPLSLPDRTAAAKHTNWAVQPPLLHLHLLIHLCTQGRSTQIETSASLKKKKKHITLPHLPFSPIVSHTELGAALPKRAFLSCYSNAKTKRSPYGAARAETFWVALCAGHTTFPKAGVCAGNSATAFTDRPSGHGARSAKLSGKFEGAGRTHGKKCHHLHPADLTDGLKRYGTPNSCGLQVKVLSYVTPEITLVTV